MQRFHFCHLVTVVDTEFVFNLAQSLSALTLLAEKASRDEDEDW